MLEVNICNINRMLSKRALGLSVKSLTFQQSQIYLYRYDWHEYIGICDGLLSLGLYPMSFEPYVPSLNLILMAPAFHYRRYPALSYILIDPKASKIANPQVTSSFTGSDSRYSEINLNLRKLSLGLLLLLEDSILH